MARFLLCLMLFSGVANASSNLWDMLSQGQHIAPITMMKNVEAHFSGVISEFAIEKDNKQIVYEVDVINPDNNSITKLTLQSNNGNIIEQKTQPLNKDDADKLKAVQKMKAESLSLSQIVQKIIKNHSAYLVEAEVDHDLDINYLELELLNNNGKQKIAFDIDHQKPLPLLTWD